MRLSGLHLVTPTPVIIIGHLAMPADKWIVIVKLDKLLSPLTIVACVVIADHTQLIASAQALQIRNMVDTEIEKTVRVDGTSSGSPQPRLVKVDVSVAQEGQLAMHRLEGLSGTPMMMSQKTLVEFKQGGQDHIGTTTTVSVYPDDTGAGTLHVVYEHCQLETISPDIDAVRCATLSAQSAGPWGQPIHAELQAKSGDMITAVARF